MKVLKRLRKTRVAIVAISLFLVYSHFQSFSIYFKNILTNKVHEEPLHSYTQLQKQALPDMCRGVSNKSVTKARKRLGDFFYGLKIERSNKSFTYPQFRTIRDGKQILKGFGHAFFERGDEQYIVKAMEYALVYEGDVKKGDVVFDVGMNFGFYSLLALAHGYLVHAFEMQGICLAFASGAAGIDGKNENLVLHHNIASVDNISVSVLNEIGRCLTGTYSEKGNQWFSPRNKANFDVVKSLSIDRVISHCAVPRVIFMKVDVDGAEIKVLESARKSLILGKFIWLFVEVNTPLEWAKVGTQKKDGILFWDWLTEEIFPFVYSAHPSFNMWLKDGVCPNPVEDIKSITKNFTKTVNILFRKVPLPGC